MPRPAPSTVAAEAAALRSTMSITMRRGRRLEVDDDFRVEPGHLELPGPGQSHQRLRQPVLSLGVAQPSDA